MALASWFLGDPLPYLPPIEGLDFEVAEDDEEMALINSLPRGAVTRRRLAGNQPYVARLHGKPVAYGWVASGLAHIVELGVSFHVPASDRYLWDFETLPEYRGNGIFPRLVEAIILKEDAGRFWLVHGPESAPCGRGCRRAGFSRVGELSFRTRGGVGLRPEGRIDRALAAARVIGVPLVRAPLSECPAGPSDLTLHPCGCVPRSGTAA